MRVILILLISMLSCNGKTNEIKGQRVNEINLHPNKTIVKENIQNMDTIYKQQHERLTLISTVVADSLKIAWKTVLIDGDNDKIVLDTFVLDKAPQWKGLQQNHGYTQMGQYTIATSFLNKNILYIVYQNAGKIILSQYSFNGDGNFDRKDIHFQNHFQTPYVSKNEIETTTLSLQNYVYLNIMYKVSNLKKEQSLYVIDLNTFSIKKIKFNEKYKIIKLFALSDHAKLEYSQYQNKIARYNQLTVQQKAENSSDAPTEKEVTFVDTVKDYLDLPYYYQEMNMDKEVYDKEKQYYENLGMRPYLLFSEDSSSATEVLPLDQSRIRNAEKYLKEVLAINNTKVMSASVKYLGYINQTQPDFMIFFFYKKADSSIKIARYSNFNNEWFLGSHVQEDR